MKMHSRRSGMHATGRAAYRSDTYSVVSAAAYRAGEKLHDMQQDITFDYSRKSGVEYSAIMAPDNAPSWAYDRQALGNAVEASEKRINSRLARELEIILPRELSAEQCVALVRSYVQAHCVDRGMVADIAIHRPEASDGKEQPHAHVLLTTRSIWPAGFGAKARD
jgi:ATP-dependent exoDNAse (exonuclease V) alpha subunit